VSYDMQYQEEIWSWIFMESTWNWKPETKIIQ